MAITVERPDRSDSGPRGPNWVWPTLAGIVLLALLALVGRVEVEAGDTQVVAADPRARPAIETDRILLHSRVEVEAGPSLVWSELDLPASVAAVFIVGELDGRPAVVGSAEPLDGRGRRPGAVFVPMGADGEWEPPVEIFGSAHTVAGGVIDEDGVVVLSTPVSAGWFGGQTLHSSPMGEAWQATTLGQDGGATLVTSIAIGPAAAWVTTVDLPDGFDQLEAYLPEEVRELVADIPGAMVVADGQVSVRLFGLTLFEAAREGPIAFADVGSDSEVQTRLLVSHDLMNYDIVADAPDLPSLGGLGSTDGAGVLRVPEGARGAARVEVSTDGRTWQPHPHAAAVQSNGLVSVVELDGRLFTMSYRGSRVVHVFGEPAVYHQFADIFGPDPRLDAAVGGLGYALPTGMANGPAALPFTIRVGDLHIEIEPSGWLYVRAAGGEQLDRFAPGDPRVAFDLTARRFDLHTEDGAVLVSFDLHDLATPAQPQTRVDATTEAGVLFTPDGDGWGWSVLPGAPGTVDVITALDVGDEAVHVVTSPWTAGVTSHPVGTGQRLWVGRPAD